MDKVRSFKVKEVAQERHCDNCDRAIILGDGGYFVDAKHLHTTFVCCGRHCVQDVLQVDFLRGAKDE